MLVIAARFSKKFVTHSLTNSLDNYVDFAEGLHWDAVADGRGETHFAGRRVSDSAEATPNQSRGEIAEEDSTQNQE